MRWNTDTNIDENHFQIGLTLERQGHLEAAIPHFEKALGMGFSYIEPPVPIVYYHQILKRPNTQSIYYAMVYLTLGVVFHRQGLFQNAIDYYQKALGLETPDLSIYAKIGSALFHQGRVEEAVVYFEKGLKMIPHDSRVYENLLFCLQALPCLSSRSSFFHFRQWAQQMPERNWVPQRKQGDRIIKIGYISPDFRDHSTSGALKLLFQHHNRQCVHLTAYSDVHKPDLTTDAFQKLADQWHDIQGQADAVVIQLIQHDAIDILIDLTGHTAYHRLSLFAQKPAPVSVTGLGFLCTTGLNTMDFRFSDPFLTPPTQARYNSEHIMYLSTVLHFSPPHFNLPVSPPPFLKNQRITFGCANGLYKLNRQLLTLWAYLMHQLPTSQLYLKARPFLDPGTSQRYRDFFSLRGIPSDRLVLLGPSSHVDHLAFYHEIDIALDPHPYHGGMTVCEAAWMGVPTVTLQGGTRTAESVLGAIGLGEWIAKTPTHYVEIAIKQASDRQKLSHLRNNLRDQLLSSSICDGKAFAQEIENLYCVIYGRIPPIHIKSH